MTSNQIIAFLVLVIIITAKKEVVIRYETHQQETDTFLKYFHRINYGYFVDLGGFNPIQYSNTVRFSNWNGIIVEANERRSTNIRDFQTHITSLNFAMSNVSGEMVTFYQSEFAQASSLSKDAVLGKPFKQQKAIVISMADLCNKYYKSKPNFLNIDVEGIGQMVLKSNDWSNDKCVPDIILAQDASANQKAGQVNLQQVLMTHNYKKIGRVQPSSLFIHNSKLQFYKKEAEANDQLVSNKILYTWGELCDAITILLDTKFDGEFFAKTHPAFPFLQQLNIISIIQINRYSNFISAIGPNRPIIILEYDEKKSCLHLGTNNFTVKSINAGKFNFKEIIANYDDGNTITIYVLDHHRYSQFNLRFGLESENQIYRLNQFQNTINDLKFSIKIAIMVILMIMIGYLWKKQALPCQELKVVQLTVQQ